eukprot:413344-Amphidinium_carterae.1
MAKAQSRDALNARDVLGDGSRASLTSSFGHISWEVAANQRAGMLLQSSHKRTRHSYYPKATLHAAV